MSWCSFSCYMLDCMDGKQARCTHQSSPLGLLFFPNGTIPKSRFCGMDVCFTVETGWDNPLGYHDGCLLFSSAYRVFHHVHTPRERIVVPSMLRIPFLLACSPLLFPEDIRKHHTVEYSLRLKHYYSSCSPKI